MPVEVKEIVIKTTIHSHERERSTQHSVIELEQMKRELMEACKQLIEKQKTIKNKYKR